MPRLVNLLLVSCLLCLFGQTTTALAVETVTFKVDDQSRTLQAEVLVEAQDGGLMLLADDGRIWTLQPDQIVSRESNGQDLDPLSDDEMEDRLLKELGDGFQIYRTQHYIVAYNCHELYAKQVAALFEQLYRNFFTFWKNQHWRLPEPKFPLVAVVLRDRRAFLKHATEEIGDTAQNVIGYYHLSSNRMTTFNVPDLERNVATIIHEATHQLAYNCKLQTRFADNPMWVSEGLATFFETPDRRNPRRWRNIGGVNRVKLQHWYQYFPKRPAESLATLLADDSRFRSAATAQDAYAECWALTFFLIKTHREEYVNYLRLLSEGKPLAERTPRERIEMFEKAFDKSLVEIDRDFIDYLKIVR